MTPSQNLYNKLQEADIKDKVGDTTFNFLGVATKIKAKSSVGYVFQDWMEKWMKIKGIQCRVPSNSQEFPDFYLHPTLNTKDLLEVKTFDADASPNFDVANFDAYTRSVKTNAFRLDADYLIFSYKMNGGDFLICDFWLKKIWEITCPSNKYAIRTQNKQGLIINIRPANWYSKKTSYKPFTTRRKFVEALYETLMKYPQRKNVSNNWLKEVKQNYKQHTGNDL
jgi:hypothetical protein